MKKRYPQLLEVGLSSISLDDLLSWSYWPDFIKLNSMIGFIQGALFTVFFVVIDGSSKAREGLPDKCLLACSCAISKMEAILMHIHDGSITVHQLKLIRDGVEQMKRLCNAMPVEAQKSLQGFELHTALKQRLDEYRMFSQQLECMQHLCHAIDPEICGKRNLKCIGERERANLVVQLARFFCMSVYLALSCISNKSSGASAVQV